MEHSLTARRSSGANSTADRAIDMLMLFIRYESLTTQDICDRLDMPRTTAYRYIASLRTHALLVEDGCGGWRLGPGIFPLARAAKAANSIMSVSEPFLRSLNEELDEAVALYERVGHESILLIRLEPKHRLRVVHPRGQMLPWPGSASAKVLLAFAEPEGRAELLRLMTPILFTPKTVDSHEALVAALGKIARDGFAFSDEEREEGVRAIAAPVRVGTRANHCIAVSGPQFRFSDERMPKISESLFQTVHELSNALNGFDY